MWAVIGNLGDSQCYLGVPQKVQAVQAALHRRIAADDLPVRLIPPAFTLGVSDGQLNGTPQMRFSLVGRELVHDVADVHLAANSVAGLVAVVACDKPPVGTVAAVLENNTPAVILSDGPIRPGIDPATGDRIDLVSAFQVADQDDEVRARFALNACPGQGSCGGMFTYNTMQTFIAVLGLEPLHMVAPPSDDPRRLTEFPDQIVDCLLAMTSRGIRPRDIVTPAVAAQRHDGRHRHGRLDQRAAAQRRDRPRRRHRPVGRRHEPGRLQPAGPAPAGAGQHAAVRRLLHGRRGRQGRAAGHRRASSSRPASSTATAIDLHRARRLAEQVRRLAPPAPDQDVIYTVDKPFKDTGGLRLLRGNLAPGGGAILKVAGVEGGVERRRLHRPGPRLQRRAPAHRGAGPAPETASRTTTWW